MEFNLTISGDDAEWDGLVAASPQGTIFSQSRYLRALGTPFKCYLVRGAGGEVLAGVPVLETPDAQGMLPAPFHYSPYQGIAFAASLGRLSRHKRTTAEYRLTEFIIQSLLGVYRNFSLSLSPQFKDLRPFLWHNYGEAGLPQFKIKHRYTALLDLADFQLEAYLMSIRTCRRQEYRKSPAVIAETDNLPLFLELYRKTFARQEIIVTPDQLDLVRRITSAALSQGFGRLTMAQVGDQVASMALFIHDGRTAHYHFSANDPEQRNAEASTKLMVESIQTMAARGVSTLDFVGVNSPNRGDFKISFNPRLEAYYEVELGGATSTH